MRVCLTAAALTLAAAAAFAQEGEYGTPEEARTMLEEAVAAVEADKEAALQAFNEGDARFSDRDLYVFCGDEGGTFTAHPNPDLRGTSMRELQDRVGEPLGERLYEAASEGEFGEVEYMWPRPGEEEPVQKNSYVTRVADQVCAVGYYEQQ